MKLETRRIYRTGKSSYVITLPKEWVENFGIKKGDVLFIELKDNSICIRPKGESNKLKTATIKDPEAKFGQLMRLIISHYLADYSSIEVLVYNNEQRKAVTSAVEMLIGAEIMEDTGNKLKVEVFLDANRFNMDSVLEKFFRISMSMLKDLRAVVSHVDKAKCNSVMARENEVDKLHFLALRLLNSYVNNGVVSAVDAMNYRVVFRHLERLSDHISQASKAMLNLDKGHPEIADKVAELEEIFRLAMISFLKKDRKMSEEVLAGVKSFLASISEYYNEIVKYSGVSIMNLKTILDSLIRIASYSSDIAEIAINRSVYCS